MLLVFFNRVERKTLAFMVDFFTELVTLRWVVRVFFKRDELVRDADLAR